MRPAPSSAAEDGSAEPSHLPWTLLVATGAAVFAAITTEILPVSLLPQISATLGTSEATGGLLVFSYAVVVAGASVPLTAVAMRWDRRRVLVLALAGMALSNAGFAAADGFRLAAAARVLGGVAHAGFFSVVFAATAASAPPRLVGRAVGVISAGNALGVAVGVPLGTALGTVIGWRWVFLATGLALAVLSGTLRTVMSPSPPPARQGHEPILRAVRARPILRVAALVALLMLGHYTAYTFVSVLLRDAGIGVLQVSAALFAYGLAGVAGVALAAATADRYVLASLRTCTCLVAVALLVFGTFAASPVTAAAALVVWGLGFGALPTLLQTLALRRAPTAPDAGSALVNTAFNVGIAGGALLGAQVLTAAGSRDVAITGGLLAAASLALTVGRSTTSSRTPWHRSPRGARS
ncbi:MAG: MFS transporter [Angustibacter sp.]